MDVGIYLKNEPIDDVDLRAPEKGNPGIGGTEFLIASLPYYVNKHYPEAADWTIFANETDKLPESVDALATKNILEALDEADSQDFDIFIWCPMGDENEEAFISAVDSYEVNVVAWVHNTPRVEMLKDLYITDQICRFVCVGQEQLDRLRDCRIFKKSAAIYNGFDAPHYNPSDGIKKKDYTVTYVGSLVPAKGFQVLAKLWPKINQQVPEAELRVIGSGKLYDRGQELGKWNIAAEEYERQFRPYLSDENGKKLDSVKFKGLVPTEEKIELMKTSQVGVVNPTGRTENCPGSAIEFQAAGTPVVSAAKRGLLDTVIHGQTGLLGDSEEQIREQIVALLKNERRARELGKNGITFVEERFSYDRVSGEWIEMFNRILRGEPPKRRGVSQNYMENWKWLREGMRLLKAYVPPVRYVPCLKEIGERDW